MAKEGSFVVEGSDDKRMGPFVEFSLLGTRLISVKAKVRRLGLKSGNLSAQQGDGCADTRTEGTAQLHPRGGKI